MVLFSAESNNLKSSGFTVADSQTIKIRHPSALYFFGPKCYYRHMERKIIIFDMDGVLFDTTAVTEQYVSDQYPGITAEMQREILCGNFHEEVAKIPLPKKEQTEEEAEKFRILYAEKKSKAPMFAGAKELLLDIHKEGGILALNTSTFSHNCLPLLDRAEITRLFDFIGTAEISKSKVVKFKMIEEKYGSSGKRVIFVTDTLGDVREADSANVPTVAVTWGVHDRNYFNREEHKNLIGIADTFEELRKFIDER
ncbi:MAG: HAD hydrolase-like protein [Candidatus Paceibacterota bacterium]|jgi:phosphoglycolate phosphatase-like HAD superfamily hydrolase